MKLKFHDTARMNLSTLSTQKKIAVGTCDGPSASRSLGLWLCLCLPVSADIITWDGNDGKGNSTWGNKSNWGTSIAPVSGDDLTFAGAFKPANTNNITGLSVNSITFASGASPFILSGNILTLGGNVLNSSANTQTINLDLVLSGNRTFDTSAGALVVGDGTAGVISGTGFGIVKSGSGTLTLNSANTYTGTTAVNGGILLVNGQIGTSAVTVSNSGTILATNATALFGSSITINGGAIFAPGGQGTVGTAAVTVTTTFNSASIFSWDLSASTSDPGANTANSGSYDQVTAATVAGTSAVFNIILGSNSFADPFWNTDKSWTNIFTGASNLDTIFTSFSGTGVSSAGVVADRGSFSFSGGTLHYTAVPEPTSALAGILLGLGLLRRRRCIGKTMTTDQLTCRSGFA